jgi:mono/diheme cytochrome c family protein
MKSVIDNQTHKENVPMERATYRRSINTLTVTVVIAAAGLVAGCGGGGGSTPVSGTAPSSAAASSSAPSSTPSGVSSADAALYASNCAGCHGDLAVSTKKGVTLARLKNAITNNIGGMGILSAMTIGEQQGIVAALNPTATPPAPPVDGATLYTANCAACHGALASSTKKGITLVRLQNAVSGNVGNMGFLSTLTSAQQQAIVTALTPGTTPAPTPTPTPTPVADGATLYTTNCAGCHGALASSGKKGITLARLQNAIAANTGNMGFLSTLTSVQQQAIVTVLTPTTPAPTPTPTPVTNGATLYASNCSGCHGALASSTKAGATAARIQTAINGNIGGMGSLTVLTSTQVSAIATSLAGVTAPPTPAPACGSCHAIPPATGKHAFHSTRATCATCHGSGYSTTAVNTATHNNGVKNLTTTIGWNATSRSCSNSCHSSKSW